MKNLVGGIAELLLRAVVYSYPPGFRRLHAAAMRDLFAEQLRDGTRAGFGKLVRVAVGGLWSNLVEGFRERVAQRVSSRDRRDSARLVGVGFFSGFVRDLRHAWRALLKRPIVSLAAILTVAVGMGANGSVFALVRATLLRQLPYENADRLVTLRYLRTDGREGSLSYPIVQRLAAEQGVLEASAGYTSGGFFMSAIEEPANVRVTIVTRGFFDVLQTVPERGRLFVESDFEPANTAVAVITHEAWVKHLASDPGAVGRSIRLGDRPVTVIGVLPADFRSFPDPGVEAFLPTEGEDQLLSFWLTGVGRMRAGVDSRELDRWLVDFQTRLETAEPLLEGRRFAAWKLRDFFTRDFRFTLLVLYAAVGIVLLVAALNFANLLLVRVSERRHELSVRSALGAGRGRIFRALIAEGAILAGAGTLLGMFAASRIAPVLVGYAPRSMSRLGAVAVDLPVLLYSLIAMALIVTVVGLVQTQRSVAPTGIGTGTRRVTERTITRSVLVGSEVALTIVLVVGSGFLVQSLWKLTRVDPGFSPANLIAVDFSIPRSRYPSVETRLQAQARMRETLESIPGVTAVRQTSLIPMTGGNWCQEAAIVGTTDSLPCTEIRTASPGYFDLMGMRLLAGRDLSDSDVRGGPPVVVINETAARMGWGDRDPIGEAVSIQDEDRQVVGVVSDVRQFTLDRTVRPEVYMPIPQFALPYGWLVARTTASPASVIPVMRNRLRDLDREIPVGGLETLDHYVALTVLEPRFRTALIGSFALIAVLLAILGVFGVIAHSVTLRTREIGVRMALGATGQGIVRALVADVLRMAGGGVVVGLPAAFIAAPVLRRFMFETDVRDPAIYVATVATVLLTAVAAGLIPARRATRVDPVEALKVD